MARKEQGRVPKRILRGKMPRASFELAGRTYTLQKVLKQDFFAATGRYVSDDGRRVCMKHYHTEPFLGVPLDWAGRLMADREVRHYRLLQDLGNVPRLVGRVGRSAFVHEWVEGNDLLDQKDRLPDDFFDRLEALLATVHARGMAYVDMNKPDNVLVGEDGRPVLIDFQISWAPRLTRGPVGRLKRRLLAMLQEADRYHVRKLKRLYRRDQMTPQEVEASYQRPWFLNLHRVFGAPLRDARRKVLEWLGTR
jgi:predicted Ser/Thr protein kinase